MNSILVRWGKFLHFWPTSRSNDHESAIIFFGGDYVSSPNFDCEIQNFLLARVPISYHNMPRKNKKVRWAKAHRAPGSKFFSKNYIDSVENLDDPDYIDEEDSCSVSDGEGWTVSLQKYGITDLGALSDSEGEREDQGYVAKDNLDHIDHGKKRKAVHFVLSRWSSGSRKRVFSALQATARRSGYQKGKVAVLVAWEVPI
ncbi:hypothetical protein EV424DRAFT_783436 [Suillus variegatus]|nr:hypothetical protein EV424DRAFT_783436 [Suillus variegatus]